MRDRLRGPECHITHSHTARTGQKGLYPCEMSALLPPRHEPDPACEDRNLISHCTEPHLFKKGAIQTPLKRTSFSTNQKRNASTDRCRGHAHRQQKRLLPEHPMASCPPRGRHRSARCHDPPQRGESLAMRRSTCQTAVPM
jgi:hypothetical protein